RSCSCSYWETWLPPGSWPIIEKSPSGTLSRAAIAACSTSASELSKLSLPSPSAAYRPRSSSCSSACDSAQPRRSATRLMRSSSTSSMSLSTMSVMARVQSPSFTATCHRYDDARGSARPGTRSPGVLRDSPDLVAQAQPRLQPEKQQDRRHRHHRGDQEIGGIASGAGLDDGAREKAQHLAGQHDERREQRVL